MKNTNESGRSMVEMLGVLAIIGVLSIGGIAGYTMAMNKLRTNDIVNAVVQAAVECRTRGTFSETEIGAQGLAFGGTKCTKAKGTVGFSITSSDEIAKLVCKALKPTSDVGGSTEITCGNSLKTDSTQMYYTPVSQNE